MTYRATWIGIMLVGIAAGSAASDLRARDAKPPAMPDTPAGKRLSAWLDAYNSHKEEVLRRFIAEQYAKSDNTALDRRLEVFRRVYDDNVVGTFLCLREAARHMRRVLADPVEAKRIGRAASRYMAKHYSTVASGSKMMERLTCVFRSLPDHERKPPGIERKPARTACRRAARASSK